MSCLKATPRGFEHHGFRSKIKNASASTNALSHAATADSYRNTETKNRNTNIKYYIL